MQASNDLDIKSWVSNEVGSVNLGDKRLNARLVSLVSSLSRTPNQSVPANCNSWSEEKAAYRFFDNKRVDKDKILQPHKLSTLSRIKEEKCVLALQDTTDIDFSGRSTLAGIGYTGNSKEAQKNQKGFFFHPTLIVTPERLCLGSIDSQIWIREAAPTSKRGRKSLVNQKSIEDKESKKWVNSYIKTKELAREAKDTVFINIGDRECDVYEFFLEYDVSIPNAHFIARSRHNRSTCNENAKLWDEILSTAPVGEIEFILPDGRGRKSRPVKQEIRFTTLELKAPQRKGRKLDNVSVTIVSATEVGCPKDEEAIQWLLLTSLKIENNQDAIKIIEYYLCRWEIELYFKIIKSGCQIERLQFESLDRIKPCLAIYMVIAWRILFTTMLGRIAPDLPSNKVFSESEWKSVFTVIHKKQPPDTAPKLNEMIKMIAGLGGFLNRKSDREPGIKTMWIGIQRMRDFALSWEMFHQLHQANTCG